MLTFAPCFNQTIDMIRYISTFILFVLAAIPTAQNGMLIPYAEGGMYAEYEELANVSSPDMEEVKRIATADNLINTALEFLGVKYRYGQSSPNGFDCSGFTMYVFNQSNIPLTRTSVSQFHEGEKVERIENLKRGDLVFFGSRTATRSVGHVGIVTEVDSAAHNFKFVHASNRGITVNNSTDAYYKARYIGARRIIY